MNTLSINEKIAEAIDMIVAQRLQNQGLDSTRIGTITEVVQSSSGSYKASIDGVEYPVYTVYTNNVYHKGDKVYIKIPQNDLTLKKFIEGLAEDVEHNSIPVYYEEGFPKFLFQGNVGLKSSIEDKEDEIWSIEEGTKQIELTEIDKTNFTTLFDAFLKNNNGYDNIKFSAKIKTKFTDAKPNDFSNYGLKFYFKEKEKTEEEEEIEEQNEPGEKIIELSLKDYTSDPWGYRVSHYTEYYRISREDIPKDYRLSKISIFQSSLFEDEKEQGDNILFKDIAIIFEKQIETEQQEENFSVNLQSEQKWVNDIKSYDVFYPTNDNIITISPQLLDLNNKDITEETIYKYYWYKKIYPDEKKYTNKKDILKNTGWEQLEIIDPKIEDEEKISLLSKFENEIKQAKRDFKKDAVALQKALDQIWDKYRLTANGIKIKNDSKHPWCQYKLIVREEKDTKSKKVVATKEFEIWNSTTEQKPEYEINTKLQKNSETNEFKFTLSINKCYFFNLKLKIYDKEGKLLKSKNEKGKSENIIIDDIEQDKFLYEYEGYVFYQDGDEKIYISYLKSDLIPYPDTTTSE